MDHNPGHCEGHFGAYFEGHCNGHFGAYFEGHYNGRFGAYFEGYFEGHFGPNIEAFSGRFGDQLSDQLNDQFYCFHSSLFRTFANSNRVPVFFGRKNGVQLMQRAIR